MRVSQRSSNVPAAEAPWLAANRGSAESMNTTRILMLAIVSSAYWRDRGRSTPIFRLPRGDPRRNRGRQMRTAERWQPGRRLRFPAHVFADTAAQNELCGPSVVIDASFFTKRTRISGKLAVLDGLFGEEIT